MTNPPTSLPMPPRTADKEQQLLIDMQQVGNEIEVLNRLLAIAYNRKRELIRTYYYKEPESVVDKSASSNPN